MVAGLSIILIVVVAAVILRLIWAGLRRLFGPPTPDPTIVSQYVIFNPAPPADVPCPTCGSYTCDHRARAYQLQEVDEGRPGLVPAWLEEGDDRKE
jgi:hypothetical protein